MEYLNVRFFNDPALNEILLAFLEDSDFEMFEERADGLDAFIPASIFNEGRLGEILSGIPGHEKFRYETILMKDINWNLEWEKNFSPVSIAGKVYLRAPFHPAPDNMLYDLVIEPKMSFGTGHHATTALMVEQMLKIPVEDKTVLDMGCGTGILAILTAKMRAKDVTAIDIDEWSFENCAENIQRNGVEQIHVHKGDAGLLDEKHFDVILANINRNVLLQDIPAYVKALNPGGQLVMSGFLTEDVKSIREAALAQDLCAEDEQERNRWVTLRFRKK